MAAIVQVGVARARVELDPPVDVFNAEVHDGEGEWRESFGSEVELKAFLRGIQVGCDMAGMSVDIPPVPDATALKFVKEPVED